MSAEATPPRRPAKRAVREPPRLDPAVAKVLQLSTFEDNYSTEDFITSLSEKHIAASKAEPGPFNPMPLMDTLSPALDELLKLREQVTERTKTTEGEVRRANREYGKRLRELDSGFEAVGSSFATLEYKITDVGRTAARIGEQLESLHQSRSSAQATSLILSYYISLVHSTSTTGEGQAENPLDALFETRRTREGAAQLAVVLRRLMAVAKDMADNASAMLVDADATDAKENGGAHSPTHRLVMRRRTEKERAEAVRDEVDKYGERFETGVLRNFDRAYRNGDPRMMQHCAKILQDFNGGASCVQIYVNQHDFFITTTQRLEEAGRDGEEQTDIWATISNPSAPAPTSEPGLVSLFKQIRETVTQEAQIVRAVFPNPIAVMKVFLQRVFAQVIQQHIESLVARATSISTLAVLRILHVSHSMCASLVETLKAYDVTLGGYATAKVEASGGPLSTMLDQALEEMFVPCMETPYLDLESKNLVELYGGLLSRFARYHETVLKAKPNSLLDRVVNSMSTSAGSPASTAHAAAAAISKYGNLFAQSVTTSVTPSKPASPVPAKTSTGIMSPQPGTPRRAGTLSPAPGSARSGTPVLDATNAADGEVTVEMAEAMLRWHAEAVGRVVELSLPGEVSKNIAAISAVLTEAIGRSFIETALDSALARLETDTKTEPDLWCVRVLHSVDLACKLWQRYTNIALVPLTSSSVVVRRELTTANQTALARMESKINATIQRAIDVIVSWLVFLLTKQNKNDYKPKDDELSFARPNTEPCEACCDFLATVHIAAIEGLSGNNAEAFLTEIGVAFHALLLEHYKKFTVNPTGGLMLTKDLASYQDSIKAFRIPALNDRFDMLRQLGNMFIVQTDALRIFIAEQHLGRIDTQLLRPYLAERSDWGTASRNLVFPDEAAGSTGGTAMGMNTQVNRLGTLGTNIGSNIGNIGTNISGSLNSITANRRLSAMSGAAGLGYQRLRDALRDFETLTDKEKEKEKAQSGPNSRPGTGTASPARDGYGTSATTGVNKPLPPSAFGRGHMVTPGFRH